MIPDGIVTSGWAPVEARCREFGDEFDEWQRGLGQLVLGKRESGEYAATVGGVTLSIPRQVAKTFIVGRIVFALCTLFPGLTVLWTAHRTRTTTKTFGSMKGYASRAAVAKFLAPDRSNGIRSTNGEQEIRFANGSIIMFGAREGGFGRGFDKVDIEVFDEAQILGEKALEDMVAATNQSQHPHGALLFFMGTPPRPIDLLKGDVFKARRDEALAGESEDAVYVECSADPDADPDDRDQWAKANPSYPHRTPLRSMLRLRKNLKSVESWLREALGIWDEDATAGQKVPPARWAGNTFDPGPRLAGPVVAVDFRTGLEQTLAIVAAGQIGEGDGLRDAVVVAHYERNVGQPWRADYAVQCVLETLRIHGLESVAVDAYGDGNGVLIPQLEEAGVTVVRLNSTDMRNGAAGFVDGNINERILHSSADSSEPLTLAVAGAGVIRSGEGFRWSQSKSEVDITALRAATAAWWVLHATRPGDSDPLASIF